MITFICILPHSPSPSGDYQSQGSMPHANSTVLDFIEWGRTVCKSGSFKISRGEWTEMDARNRCCFFSIRAIVDLF